jgi:hypothetical protein
MKLNKKPSELQTETPPIIKPDDSASAKEDGIIIEEVKEEADESGGEPRKKYDPKRQEFVMMYVIQKGRAAAV